MPDMRVPPHPILAEGQVHAVGMPVAAVVAEDVYAAYDALDLIGVDYEPLPGLPEPEAALAPGAPLLFSGIDGNRALTGPFGKVTRRAPSRPRRTWCRCAWPRTGSPRWRWSRARSWPASTG